MFLKDYGMTPEVLRHTPVYDIYMLMYAKLAKYINETGKPKGPAAKAGSVVGGKYATS